MSQTLVVPAEWPLLEPFATVLINVVVPEATRGRWFEARQTPAAVVLRQISRRIESDMERTCDYRFHPAIYLHSLMVCVDFLYETALKLQDPLESESQTAVLDETYALLRHLVIHHGLYEMYMRLV